MITNLENKSMDMELRDWNYIMPAYIRTYLFSSKNEDPEKIIFPMFMTVPHPTKPGVNIPVEFVAVDSPIATEIAQDGSNVAEVTPEQEAALDAKDEEIKRLKAQVVEMEVTPAPEDLLRQQEEAEQAQKEKEEGELLAVEASDEAAAVAEADAAGELAHIPARPSMDAAFGESDTTTSIPDRKPNLPAVVIPPGQTLDNMSSRDRSDQTRIAKDLIPEPEVNEEEEIPAEITKPKEE